MLVTDDSPFLVDTVRMVLLRANRATHLLVHPLIDVDRNADCMICGIGGDIPEAWDVDRDRRMHRRTGRNDRSSGQGSGRRRAQQRARLPPRSANGCNRSHTSIRSSSGSSTATWYFSVPPCSTVTSRERRSYARVRAPRARSERGRARSSSGVAGRGRRQGGCRRRQVGRRVVDPQACPADRRDRVPVTVLHIDSPACSPRQRTVRACCRSPRSARWQRPYSDSPNPVPRVIRGGRCATSSRHCRGSCCSKSTPTRSPSS